MNRMSQLACRYNNPSLTRPLPAIPRIVTSVEPLRRQLPHLPRNRTPHHPPSSYRSHKSPPSEISWSSVPWNDDGPTSFYHESVAPTVRRGLQRRDSIHGVAVARRALPSTPTTVTQSRTPTPTGSGGRSVRPLPSPPQSQSTSPQESPAELASPAMSDLDMRNDSFPSVSPLDSMNMDLPLPYFCTEEGISDNDEPAFIEWDILEAVLGCDSAALEVLGDAGTTN